MFWGTVMWNLFHVEIESYRLDFHIEPQKLDFCGLIIHVDATWKSSLRDSVS